jgi:hypothetical protein
MLAELTLQRVCIAPDTPLKAVLKFKTDHSRELGRFRTKLGEVAKTFDQN